MRNALIQKGRFNPDRVYHRRAQLGWSLDKVAEESGLSKASIQAYETGRWAPTMHSLRLLSLALQVTPDYFFDGKSN